ncbi:hypothetical protein [Ureibacillus sp. FSL K6-3587]|uniref:hypothetical protein n=1 Tax=Ureibacillus sp. FSL K6-3587 TaxID=2954681 RepID=UPI0031597A2A
MMVRHVTQLLWKMCFGDYILPEFCHCLIFLFKKIGAGLYSPTPNIIEPKYIAALKIFFSYLTETGLIKDNPMNRIKMEKIEYAQSSSQTKWLTKEEQERFISYVELEKMSLNASVTLRSSI